MPAFQNVFKRLWLRWKRPHIAGRSLPVWP